MAPGRSRDRRWLWVIGVFDGVPAGGPQLGGACQGCADFACELLETAALPREADENLVLVLASAAKVAFSSPGLRLRQAWPNQVQCTRSPLRRMVTSVPQQ